MSTTIKRVALVAVAALGLGVVSVAPSQAAAQLDSISVSAATASQIAGETQTATSVVVTGSLAAKKGEDTLTVTASIVSGPAYVQPILAFKETTTADYTATGPGSVVTVTPLDTNTVTQATAKFYLYLNQPTTVGTYVVKLTPTGTPNAVATTVSITVSAKTLGWSSVYLDNGTGTPTADTTTALSYSALPNTAVKASITVRQGYGATKDTNLAANADAAAVVVTTDKGLISKSALTYADSAKTVTVAAATAATSTFYIYSNGDVGKATITITVGTNAAVTKNVTFTGAATDLVATPTTAAPLWVTLGSNKTTTITAKDSAGSAVDIPVVTYTVTSSDTAVATATITSGVVTVVPVAAGNATITITDPSTTGAAKAVTFPVHVAPIKSKVAPVISFDKTAYNVGDLVTMTVSSDMGDSATATLFATKLISSASVVVTSNANPFESTTVKMESGKATYTFYAPAVSGSFTVKAMTGDSVDLTDLLEAKEVSKTVDIVNTAVDAATEAAEQAAQNADDATNAALAAADQAELATEAAQDAAAAVEELKAQVNTLIKSLQAQLTTLKNLVAKIAKKVKA